MRKKILINNAVKWLSGEILNETSSNFKYFEKFQFKNIVGEVGDFVLVSNADAAEPDTEEGCDVARIVALYEDPTHKSDPFRAKVQWYSKPSDLPVWCKDKMDEIDFFNKEVIEDYRPFDIDISIETFFKKCSVTLTFTRDTDDIVKNKKFCYICRYKLLSLSKRKVQIEPVLEEERKAMELLCTPSKNLISSRTPKTPNTLIKQMSRVSLSEQKNWSVSKNDGTKLLLKRAILADKSEKDSPKKSTSNVSLIKNNISKSLQKIDGKHLEDALTMELQEHSDDELPTLIIRQHAMPNTPKRKPSTPKISQNTPKSCLNFDNDIKENYSTRSGRITKNPSTYQEQDISPIKRTPRKSIKKVACDDSEDEFMPAPKTPKTPRTPRTPIVKTARKSVSRRIMTSALTPTLRYRAHSVDNLEEFLKENKSLPGREHQMEDIMSFVRNKLLDGSSGCMYISGVPGTGKTATVNAALKYLKEADDLPDFQLVEINGMKIAEPRQAYVQIYKQLTGKTVVWEHACTLLEKRFTNTGPRRTPTVLLVDELDALCTRRQDVLYSIMEWTTHRAALLSVLAVANTMDLPERALAARVASRLGLTRLAFPPYSHAQLQAIVAATLAPRHMAPDALQLLARKVAAVSGDARRALALCSRAIELAGGEGAGLQEVQQALTEATSGASVAAIRHCSAAERLMLRAVAAEVERTGSDETTLSRALSTAGAIVALDGRPYRAAPSIRPPTPEQALAICARLASMKLLLLEPKTEPRLLLNVATDDVHYATRDITV